jgi:hypothetical protein
VLYVRYKQKRLYKIVALTNERLQILGIRIVTYRFHYDHRDKIFELLQYLRPLGDSAKS